MARGSGWGRHRHPEFVITVNSFIPEEWVTSPFLGPSENVQIFEGDNRSFQRTGMSRIHQEVRVSLNGARNFVRIGKTVSYDSATSLDQTNHLTAEAKADSVLNDGVLKTGEATASSSGVTVQTTRSGGVVTAVLSGGVSNPLVVSPDIDYEVTITVEFSNSYAHGLLHAAGVPHSERAPGWRPTPGWKTPVPAIYFP